jgi:hypothetical protein
MTFRMWLDEWIYWGSVEQVPRYVAIYRFVKYGLYPFIKQNRYNIREDLNDFTISIASMLYLNRGASCLNPHDSLICKDYNTLIEYKQHFYHILNDEKWASFWNKWGTWTDVSLDDFRGADRRIDIEGKCWEYIDFDSSYETTILHEHLGLENEDSSIRYGEDVYLREAAESNEWGGYRR